MEGLVQVANEMYEKFERLLCAVVPLLEPHCRVTHCAEHVVSWCALPTIVAERAVVRGMVAHAADVVQRARPVHVHSNFVGPRSYWRQVALRVLRENRAELLDDGGVEVDLGYGSNYFVSLKGG